MNKVAYKIALVLLIMPGMALAEPNMAQGVTHAELMRMIIGLLFVLLIIISLSWIMKKLNVVNLSSSKGFQSLASMTLGPKEKIVLLKVGQQHLLIGSGAGTVTLLYDFGEHLPEGFSSDEKPSFAQILKSARRKSSR